MIKLIPEFMKCPACEKVKITPWTAKRHTRKCHRYPTVPMCLTTGRCCGCNGPLHNDICTKCILQIESKSNG